MEQIILLLWEQGDPSRWVPLYQHVYDARRWAQGGVVGMCVPQLDPLHPEHGYESSGNACMIM